FFFQAEDGIRDRNVTGVQTCALPIYLGRPPHFPVEHHERSRALGVERAAVQQVRQGPDRREAVVERVQHVRRTFVEHHVLHFGRSEERRVGKGGRSGWGAYDGEERGE